MNPNTMNPENLPPSGRPKRTRKPSKPRAPRIKDQRIIEIEAQAKLDKAEYRKSLASGGVLKRIVDKMLPKLSQGDRGRLIGTLSATETQEKPNGQK